MNEAKQEVRTILEWRRHFHETRQQFATRLGVSMSALKMWEEGKEPRESVRQRIADRLGVAYDQITYGNTSQKEHAA